MAELAPRRRSWLRLYGVPLSLEQSCRKAHEFASRHPVLYRWRVRSLLAKLQLLPFFTLAFLCTVTLAFPWACRESEMFRPIYAQPLLRWPFLLLVYSSLIPLVAFYFAAVFRGLTLRLPAPSGIPLTEQQAPRLFRILTEMTRVLDAPAIDAVMVSPDRLLEIRRLPRGAGGVLGRAQTILLAGLPVLEELSPQQLRALLAHEMAHLATHNRHFGGRVLGLRVRWSAFRQAAEASALDRGYWSRLPDEGLADILDGLLRRLIPETFPVARQHESEADAIAASIAGREFAAAALLRQRIAGHALTQQFHQDCLRLAETTPEPPADLFDCRALTASGPFSEAQIHAWLRSELEHKDNLAESHPLLWDRLRLLGYRLEGLEDFRALLEQVQPHRELGETAARFFLADTAESLRAEFFREWAQRQSRDWRMRFETYEKLRSVAGEWHPGSEASVDDPGALWQMAVAIGNTRGWRAALPLAQRILALQPDHADASLLVGQLLIEEENSAGLESLERAMAASGATVPVACALAARFLENRGEQQAAAGYRKRAEEHQKAEQALAQERSHVRATDILLTPNCPEATRQALRGAVEPHSSHIRAAYVVRKQIAGGERRPFYVLGIERRMFPYENTARSNRLLLERILRAPGVPADVLVCVVTKANRALLNKWRSVADSLLLPALSSEQSEADHFAAGKPQSVRPAAPLLNPAEHAALPARATPATMK